MSTPRDYRDCIEDILDAARKALGFVQGMRYEDFAADDKTAFATVRALEIVGEAAKKIPQSVRDRYPDIPWRYMAGIRDKLIHDYINVSLRVVWQTVNEDLPGLLTKIEAVAGDLSDPSS